MFRDPYDWVEAMRMEPHHSPFHTNWLEPFRPNSKLKKIMKPMSWHEFVTKPWAPDIDISKGQDGFEKNATCIDKYGPDEIVPCLQEVSDAITVKGVSSLIFHAKSSYIYILSTLNTNAFLWLLSNHQLGVTKYEFKHDGSRRVFESIIDLRRDKILNHLSVAEFQGARKFLPFRFEDLNANGTAALLRSVEAATGLKANCKATEGKAPHRRLLPKKITKHKPLQPEFIRWMNKFVDWEVESKIGYHKREQ